MNCESNKCDFCGEIKIVSRQYLHAKNKESSLQGNGFSITYYCNDCGLLENCIDNSSIERVETKSVLTNI